METESISTHIEKLSMNDWEKLFALIPIIESTKEFVIEGGVTEDENDPESFTIAPITEVKVVFDFERIMYKLGLIIPFDWIEWDEGREIVEKGNFSNLDTITLLKTLTAFIRNNRFCDGALAERFEDGTVEKVLREVKKNVEGQ